MLTKSRSRRQARSGLQCPHCGNAVFWSLYRAVIRVEHMQQTGPRTWRRMRTENRRYDLPLPLCMVCERCGHPAPVPERVRASSASHAP